MDHPLPHARIRPWRTATLVASTVALVELAALLALAVPALGRQVADEVKQAAVAEAHAPIVRTPPPAAAKAKAAAPALARGETSVIVLNGNGVSGAASREAARVRGLGYLVAATGNARRSDYRRTLVMYRPGHEAEARRLAKDIGGKSVVAPVDGMKPRELMGAQLALVLGAR